MCAHANLTRFRSLQLEADGGRAARAPSFRSDNTGDRLKAHAIVLALMLSEWKCQGPALASALGLPPRKLEENFKDVGCVYVVLCARYFDMYRFNVRSVLIDPNKLSSSSASKGARARMLRGRLLRTWPSCRSP